MSKVKYFAFKQIEHNRDFNDPFRCYADINQFFG